MKDKSEKLASMPVYAAPELVSLGSVESLTKGVQNLNYDPGSTTSYASEDPGPEEPED